MKNYYEILGLENNSTEEQIKTAYRKLSLKFHPDKNDGDNYFSEWAKKINEAYEALGDSNKRKQYDNLLISENNKENTISKNETSNYFNSEFEVLNKIKKLTPEFLNAKYNLAEASIHYNNVSSRNVPNKFSATRILFIILLFIVSAFGFKKIYTTTQTEKYTEENSIVTATSGLSIRDKPNKNGVELVLAPYNSKLKIINENAATDYINNKSGFWYKVEFKGTVGYAWGNYIEKN